jgi:hypothetical protein
MRAQKKYKCYPATVNSLRMTVKPQLPLSVLRSVYEIKYSYFVLRYHIIFSSIISNEKLYSQNYVHTDIEN